MIELAKLLGALFFIAAIGQHFGEQGIAQIFQNDKTLGSVRVIDFGRRQAMRP